MNLEELKQLESRWTGPEANKGLDDIARSEAVVDWQPIEGLMPYRDKWAAVVDGPDLNQEEVRPELSAAYVDAVRKLWLGTDVDEPASSGPGHCGNAGHFHCYKTTTRGKGARVWEPWRRQSSGAVTWWCSSLQEAGHRYSWPNHPAGTFEQLSAALQGAMRAGNEATTNVVCRKILDWGGVRGRPHAARVEWLDEQTQRGNLISSIRTATRALRATSTSSLDAVFSEGGIPMTSGTTKIFAAAAMDFSAGWFAPTQDVLIFDGRVTGALGLIARRVSHALPDAFRFPSSRESKRRRDASCAHLTLPNLHSLSNVERARFARLGAYCIDRIVGKSEFLLAEKALFMIGYDVRWRCDSQSRACP
ncbi:hypothetical protein [Burkholderia sp. HI2500]|uniref:hypothetical protein n=1 Tax=Burkholderia sp. HI2500 TaxID=2015358 RepID=UPI00117F2DA0|nr:hypothetical protein [Burkholderia sp. HI2500]